MTSATSPPMIGLIGLLPPTAVLMGDAVGVAPVVLGGLVSLSPEDMLERVLASATSSISR